MPSRSFTAPRSLPKQLATHVSLTASRCFTSFLTDVGLILGTTSSCRTQFSTQPTISLARLSFAIHGTPNP